MKKISYCPNCKLEFEYNINNMEEFNNFSCPKCNRKVSNNYVRPKQITKADLVAESILSKVLKIYFYFYLIMSTIGLIGYLVGNQKLFEVTIFIALILYIIELLLGYTRNIFGLMGILISILICSYLLNDIKTGIFLGSAIIFMISGLLRIIFWFIIYKMDKRLKKN